ncbi:MAG: hypothetical protein ACRD0S_13530 [Acidimicrobiales bacterium]
MGPAPGPAPDPDLDPITAGEVDVGPPARGAATFDGADVAVDEQLHAKAGGDLLTLDGD